MYCQHLQRLHTLDHPAVSLIDPGCFHLEEGVGHAAPQHGTDGLHIQTGRTLGHRVLVFTLEDGWRQRHGILVKTKRRRGIREMNIACSSVSNKQLKGFLHSFYLYYQMTLISHFSKDFIMWHLLLSHIIFSFFPPSYNWHMYPLSIVWIRIR